MTMGSSTLNFYISVSGLITLSLLILFFPFNHIHWRHRKCKVSYILSMYTHYFLLSSMFLLRISFGMDAIRKWTDEEFEALLAWSSIEHTSERKKYSTIGGLLQRQRSASFVVWDALSLLFGLQRHQCHSPKQERKHHL